MFEKHERNGAELEKCINVYVSLIIEELNIFLGKYIFLHKDYN